MDKASLRRLHLIDILSSQEKWFKTEELAKNLNCTEKTIRTDIQIINATLPEGWQIETIKGKGIYINNPINSSLDQVRSLFVKNSLSLQVIMFILIKEIEHISDLGKVLYTHHNTVYKILERVDTLLKSYNLSLKRAPLEIVGNEFQKRILCCDVLYGLYSHTNKWPYDSLSFSIIKKVVTKSAEENNLLLFPPTIYKYIYYVGTMIQRIDRDIQLDLNPSNNIKDSKFFSVATDICGQLEKIYKVSIPLNEINALSIMISASPYFSSDNEPQDEIIISYHHKSKKQYIELHELVTMLEKKLGIKLHDHNDFILTLQKQFKAFSLVLFLNGRIDRSCLITEYVKKRYPELFHKVKTVFRNWCNYLSYPEVNNEVIAKITLNIQAIIIKLSFVKKRVLLLSSEGYGVRQYITAKLIKEFGDKIQFVELQNGELSPETISELRLDFIIADFQIDLDIVPIAVISSTLSQRDINHIAHLLK
ncbi:BglG family transcription antiterminator [Gottfriedia acidiceleris]|uniref:BglG family transcription antiterminator n=1 Tax=Gottfriedia acidiceleris TaxID=371036 RepID=UPI00101D3CAD|nr:helix-turn-helix domain-containing protein [Gottfriedia acidiceleris]